MFSISNPSLVRKAASVIASIALKLNPVEIVTPLNQRKEKKLWLTAANRGVFRNPVFIYDETRLRDIASLERKLANAEQQLSAHIKPQTQADSVIYELIKSRIRDASTSIDMAHNILVEDDDETAYNTALKYGRPSPEQLDFAHMLASGHFKLGNYESCFSEDQQTRLKAMSFDANAICEQFQRALHFYGIEGWRVEIDECASAIDVRNKTADGTPRVVIPVNRKVNGLKLIELIGHEIECHLRDSENAAELFRDILRNESPLAPLIPLLANRMTKCSTKATRSFPMSLLLAKNPYRNRSIRLHRISLSKLHRSAVSPTPSTNSNLGSAKVSPLPLRALGLLLIAHSEDAPIRRIRMATPSVKITAI